MMKRVFDVITVLVLMPVWLPVYLVVSCAIAIFDGCPVMFKQKRAGYKGASFNIIKFRTMRSGDGSDLERTTKLGRFLRSTSLDELPQLWLVLSGKMSLVGPRPLPLKYLPLYTTEQSRRHNVLPGITGWAQVNGRNAISWEKKFLLDIWYVENISIFLDFKILAMTALKVFNRAGINNSSEQTMPEFTGQNHLTNGDPSDESK